MHNSIFFFLLASLFPFMNLQSSQTNPCSLQAMTISSYESSGKQTTILLNNGTLWTYSDIDLFPDHNGWQINDRVSIVYVYLHGYFLQNLSYQGCIPVKLINKTSSDILSSNIREIIYNPKKATNTITLDDGTQWFIGSWSSSWMHDWDVGDRIVATTHDFMWGNAEHLLINLDKISPLSDSNVRAQLTYSQNRYSLAEDLNKRPQRQWRALTLSAKSQNNAFKIELDNGTIWQCSVPEKLWQVGDEVSFKEKDKQLKLVNLKSSEEINVALINGNSKNLKVLTVKKCTGKKLILSDESNWFTSSLFGIDSFDWKINDRIIVTSAGGMMMDTTTHKLVNIDRTDNDHVAIKSATLIR